MITVALLTAAMLAGNVCSAFGQVTTVILPAGTRILVRMTDSVNSKKDSVGKRFRASLESNLQVNGVVVARRGSNVYGRLVVAKPAGRLAGSGQLTLELTDIMIHGTAYPIVTDTVHLEATGSGASYAGRAKGAGGPAGCRPVSARVRDVITIGTC